MEGMSMGDMGIYCQSPFFNTKSEVKFENVKIC